MESCPVRRLRVSQRRGAPTLCQCASSGVEAPAPLLAPSRRSGEAREVAAQRGLPVTSSAPRGRARRAVRSCCAATGSTLEEPEHRGFLAFDELPRATRAMEGRLPSSSPRLLRRASPCRSTSPTRTEVGTLVARVNETLGSARLHAGWSSTSRTTSRHDSWAALAALRHPALVNPIRDGLNLVAMEGPASTSATACSCSHAEGRRLRLSRRTWQSASIPSTWTGTAAAMVTASP